MKLPIAALALLASSAAAEPRTWTFHTLKFSSQVPALHGMNALQKPLRALDLAACGTYTAFFIGVELGIAPSGAVASVKLVPHTKQAPIDDALRTCASGLFEKVTFPARKRGSTLSFAMMYRRP